MSPQQKQVIGITMLHVYRIATFGMLSMCTFFLNSFYKEHQILIQDDQANQKAHIRYDNKFDNLSASIYELQGKANGLENRINVNRSTINNLQQPN